jgi:hypothetical protein
MLALAHTRHELFGRFTAGDLPEILQLLEGSDPETSAIAAASLISIQDASPSPLPGSAIALLGTQLRDTSENVSLNALNALVRISKKSSIDEAVTDLIASLDIIREPERLLDVINLLGGSRNKKGGASGALRNVANHGNAIVAAAAIQALERLGDTTIPETEKAAVQKLVARWKEKRYNRYDYFLGNPETADEYTALRSFPNPMAVCKVLTETLLAIPKSERPEEFGKHYGTEQFPELLVDIGDPRFLNDLMVLYEAFRSNPVWEDSAYRFSSAVLRIPSGWERIRQDMSAHQATACIVDTILGTGSIADEIDYSSHLAPEEKTFAISEIMARYAKESAKGDDLSGYRACQGLRRLGLDALKPLVNLHETTAPEEAASAICDLPGALDSVSSNHSSEYLDKLIAKHMKYSRRITENLLCFMGKLRTPQCIALLRQTAKAEFRDRATTVRLNSLATTLLGKAAEPEASSDRRRYKVSKEGVITDAKTKLQWYLGRDEQRVWQDAKSWAEGINVDGGGWRLPSREELKTLYSPGVGRRNRDPVFKSTAADEWTLWSGDHKDKSDSSNWYRGIFNFREGEGEGWVPYTLEKRAYAVRARK